MLIQCGNCGAPLDVDEGRTVVRCSYCRGSNDVRSTKTISQQTPHDWRAPRSWTPPADAKAPSTPLSYRSQRRAVLIATAISGLVLLSAASAILATRGTTRSASDAEAEAAGGVAFTELAATDLDITLGAFVERFPSATPVDGEVTLALDGPGLARVHVAWNEAGDRVSGMRFDASEATRDWATLVERFRALLGYTLDTTSEQYATARYPDGGRLTILEDGGVTFAVEPDDDCRSDDRARGDALWTAVRNAALGVSQPIDERTQELLRGYTLTRAAEADVGGVVDDSYERVSSVLPGAAAMASGPTFDVEVPIDHPWFVSISMGWANEDDGHIAALQVWSRGESFEDMDRIARCLEPVLGEAEIEQTARIGGERRFYWGRAGSYYEEGGTMGGNNLWLPMRGTEGVQERYVSILRALDPCGRR